MAIDEATGLIKFNLTPGIRDRRYLDLKPILQKTKSIWAAVCVCGIHAARINATMTIYRGDSIHVGIIGSLRIIYCYGCFFV